MLSLAVSIQQSLLVPCQGETPHVLSAHDCMLWRAADGNNLFGVSGVAQHAQLMILKVVDTQQRGFGSASTALEAWAYATRQGARVMLNRYVWS
jgi:hypothetical protein